MSKTLEWPRLFSFVGTFLCLYISLGSIFGVDVTFADEILNLLNHTEATEKNLKPLEASSGINYTTPNDHQLQDDHHGSVSFTLVELAKWFVDVIQPNRFPDYLLSELDLSTTDDQFLGWIRKHHSQWLNYNIGFIVSVCVFAGFTLIFTFLYLLYVCCSRLCVGRCVQPRSRLKYADDWHDFIDPCRRHSLNFLLIFINVTILCFTAGATVSIYASHTSVNKYVPNVLESKSMEIVTSCNTLYKQVHQLLVVDLETLQNDINRTICSAGDKISLDNLNSSLPSLKNFSQAISEFESWLASFHQSLDRNLTNVVHRIEAFNNRIILEVQRFHTDLDNCSSKEKINDETECRKSLTLADRYSDDLNRWTIRLKTLKKDFEALLANANFSSDTTELVGSLRSTLNWKVDQESDDIEAEMDKIREKLKPILNAFSANVIEESQLENMRNSTATYGRVVLAYERYFWVVTLVVSSVIIFVAVLFLFGFLLSCCGSHPDYKYDKCCVWSKSLCLFTWAIAFALIFLFVIAIFTCVLLFIGGNIGIVVCDNAMQVDSKSAVQKLSQRFFQLTKPKLEDWLNEMILAIDEKNSDSRIILDDMDAVIFWEKCKANQTMYNIFNIANKTDVLEFKELRSQIQERINTLASNFPFARRDLQLPSSFFTSFTDFDKFANELQTALQKNQSAAVLMPNIDQRLVDLRAAPLNVKDGAVRATLVSFVRRLEERDNDTLLVRSLSDEWQAAADAVLRLFSRRPDVSWATNAPETARRFTSSVADDLALDTSRRLLALVDAYRDHIQHKLETEVANCGPIATALSDIHGEFCNGIVDNLNAYWAGIGIGLLLLMPVILIATALKGMYSKALRYDNDSRGTNNSRRCIVDAYSTVTDDYACYRRGSGSSYNRPIGHNVHVQRLNYHPSTSSGTMYFTDVDQCALQPYIRK